MKPCIEKFDNNCTWEERMMYAGIRDAMEFLCDRNMQGMYMCIDMHAINRIFTQ